MLRNLTYLAAVTTILTIWGCRREEPAPQQSAEGRGLLLRTLAQAGRDSATLVAGAFHATVAMSIALRQSGDDTVRVDERFLLKKEGGRGYSADSVVRHVAGDTSILKSMYSFEDSKGNPRSSSERAQLASLSFGTSFPVLLRELLAGSEGTGYRLADSGVTMNGSRCYQFTYQTPQKDGSFWVDNGSLDLVRLEVRQQSNYWVGSYEYHALIDFARPAGPSLLPVRTSAGFGYRRLFTRGTGTVAVLFEAAEADSSRSGNRGADSSHADSLSAASHAH